MPQARLAGLIVLAALGFALSHTSRQRFSEPSITFLDVGQGDAILLQQNTQQILIDGGPEGTRLLEQLGRHLPLLDRRIEVVILTHPQADHLSGLLSVLRNYRVGVVLMPRLEHTSTTFRRWVEALLASETTVWWAEEEQRLLLGDLIIEVLAPPREEEDRQRLAQEVNNASVVLQVRRGKIRFLLAGDIERTGELWLWARKREQLAAEVLKVGHHGARSSTSPLFLGTVNPAIAVISVGKDNRFHHPHAELLQRLRGRCVLRTDQHGSITFWLTATQLYLHPAAPCVKMNFKYVKSSQT
jgi:competence protein ComEC